MIYFDERWDGAHGIGRFSGELSKRIEHRVLPAVGRPMSAFDPVYSSLAARKIPVGSIFFSPGYNAPLWSRQPFVFTIHDLNHIDRPENSSVARRLFYSTVLRGACTRAARVLTVSDFSRRRIHEWSGVALDQIVNVGNGVSEDFNPKATPHCPGYDYVLCVSNRRLHKNEFRLVTAFAQSGLDARTRLVFTGEPTAELIEHIAKAELADRIVFMGRVDDSALPGIYRGALCLAFPSLYEGFGLPVIEAFACGTPVVTSTTSSLPEVAAGAALLVDPMSISELSAALLVASTDDAVRQRMIKLGYSRAASFSWQQVASRVEAVLQGVLAK